MVKKSLKSGGFLLTTGILITLMVSVIAFIIKPQEILNIQEYQEKQAQYLRPWLLQIEDYTFNSIKRYEEQLEKENINETKKKIALNHIDREEQKEERRKQKFWFYSYVFISLIFLFNFTLYYFLSITKVKKKKGLISSILTLSIFLAFLAFCAFTVQSADSFKAYYAGRYLYFNQYIYYLGIIIILPILLTIAHFKWLYGKPLLIKLTASYNTFLVFVILFITFLFCLISHQDFIDVFYHKNYTYQNVRNIVTIGATALFLFLLKTVVNYSKVLTNIKNGLFYPFVFLFRILIGSLVIYSLFFFSSFITVLIERDTLFYYRTETLLDFIIKAYEYAPIKIITYILIAHSIIWLVIKLSGLGKEGWLNPSDPWLPHNNIDPIPNEIDEGIRLAKANKINSKNVAKVSKMLDIGLNKTNALKIKYKQILEKWKNQEALSDQDWRNYGNKMGYGRHYQYSRFSMGSIRQRYIEEIHTLDWKIREANEIKTKIDTELINEMAFQSVEGTVTSKQIDSPSKIFKTFNKQLKANLKTIKKDDFD